MLLNDSEQDDIVILYTAKTRKVAAAVARLRAEQPARRIVVLTDNPTWQEARAVFEAGAIDYLPQTTAQAERQRIFGEIRRRPLPPWPR